MVNVFIGFWLLLIILIAAAFLSPGSDPIPFYDTLVRYISLPLSSRLAPRSGWIEVGLQHSEIIVDVVSNLEVTMEQLLTVNMIVFASNYERKPPNSHFKAVWQRTRKRPTPGKLREPAPPTECRMRLRPPFRSLPKGSGSSPTAWLDISAYPDLFPHLLDLFLAKLNRMLVNITANFPRKLL